MDPLADNFVAELSERLSPKELFVLMRFLLNEYVWIDYKDLDEKTSEYLSVASQIPDWADEELLKKGSDFFAIHGFEISMILMMKALPATYCCWRGAEVVHATGRMTEHSGNLMAFTRRLMQTSKFVLNVLSKDGITPNGIGVKSAVKVRTLHAFIRHFLKNEDWDTEKYGEPINQEDYAGTMLSFSVFVIEGLERMGVKCTEEERKAYFHVWRVVAHIIGIEPELISDNYDDGSKLGHAILNQQKGASQSGKELTEACVNFCKELMPLRILKFLPQNLMYFLLGSELSEMVGIKKSRNPIVNLLVFLFRVGIKVYEWMKDNIGFVHRIALKYNPKLLDIIIRKFLSETKVPFSPKILQQEVSEIRRQRD